MDLPDDIREALLDCAKSTVLDNYMGGSKKLTDFTDFKASMVRIYSWSLPDSKSRPKNLRRLVSLANQGILIECQRSDYKNSARSFTVNKEQLASIGNEAVRYWQSFGYIVGQLMPKIENT